MSAFVPASSALRINDAAGQMSSAEEEDKSTIDQVGRNHIQIQLPTNSANIQNRNIFCTPRLHVMHHFSLSVSHDANTQLMIPLLFMCRRDRRAAFALAFPRLMAPTEHTCLEVTDTYFDTNECQCATCYHICWPKGVMFFFFVVALTGDHR